MYDYNGSFSLAICDALEGEVIMIRMFQTHQVRSCQELTGTLWEFMPCQGEYAGRVYQVATPCCWENHPDFMNYRGEGIYRTSFNAAGTIRLEFKGVSHTATVTLDGKQIASHYNAYTIFDAVVRDLDRGDHILEIKADNRFSEKSALHIPNDYMSYGGISRPVVLEEIGELYIRQIHVTPYRRNGLWHVRVEMAIENLSECPQCISACVQITEDKECTWENVSVGAGEQIILSGELSFEQAVPWTPDNPQLYYVTGQIIKEGTVIDDLIDRFGFREIQVKGQNIYLNDFPVKIKGVCRHEDHPQFGCALPFAAIAADLEIIKDLGANSIRTAHYPNDEIFLDLCDEQGILVWEENHARGLSLEDMKNPNFEEQAEQVIHAMISEHYNHPSIYIWGILNECASDSEYGKQCYEKQFAIIKELDQTRPHSFASCKFKTDLCFGMPDVVSYNIYPLWYHDTPADTYMDDLYNWVQNETEGAGKPYLITEIGAGGIYGYRAAHEPKWSEEYQAKTLEKQLRAVLSHPHCSGGYIWQFCDIRVSDEWFGGRPRTMNNKGIVDEYRRRKLCYGVVKKIFHA